MDEFSENMPASRTIGSQPKPLLGLTILLVEDSRYFSDAVRLLAIRSGARLRRADCLNSARKHIRLYRPDIVIADLGLPDGSGQSFVKEVSSSPGAPPIIAMSGDDENDLVQSALDAGASKFLQKPFYDLAAFQQTILSLMSNEIAPSRFQPRMAGEEVTPDIESLDEDYTQIKNIICESIPKSDRIRMQYCVQFLSSTARITGDHDLLEQAEKLAGRLQKNEQWENAGMRVIGLLERRLSA